MFSDYKKTDGRNSRDAEERPTQEVKLPAKLVRECAGFSFDIGGSVMKLVYRTKSDFDEAQNLTDKNATSTVHLTSFSRAELEDSIEFIQKNTYVTRVDGEHTHVFVTGYGGSQYQEKMEKALNAKLSIIGEGDCFNYAFGYLLKNITMDDLVHPFEEKAALKSINEGTATYASVIAAMQAGVI